MPPTRQPVWEFVANLGDAHPLDYGGYFVYRDTTGVYEEEAEFWNEPDEEDGPITVYRIMLERKKMVGPYLVPLRYDPSWRHPVEQYDEWFHKDLADVAESVGLEKEAIEEMLCSGDPIKRANAYWMIGQYHGWENLDSYPETYTRREAKQRYRKELQALRP